MSKTTHEALADLNDATTRLGNALFKPIKPHIERLIIKLCKILQSYTMIDIRTEKREDGKTWFTPYRRIFPFIWTQYFKSNQPGVKSQAMSSTNLDDVKKFIEEVAPKCS